MMLVLEYLLKIIGIEDEIKRDLLQHLYRKILLFTIDRRLDMISNRNALEAYLDPMV
jgi:hypothetical protein